MQYLLQSFFCYKHVRVFLITTQLLDATSEGTTPTKLKGGLTMARNGLRTRPPGVDPRATDCDGRWIPFTSIHIARSYCSLVRLPNTHSLVLVTAISRMRAGPMVRETFWSSKLSTHRSSWHWFCIVAI